jgi:hypothetical protein
LLSHSAVAQWESWYKIISQKPFKECHPSTAVAVEGMGVVALAGAGGILVAPFLPIPDIAPILQPLIDLII